MELEEGVRMNVLEKILEDLKDMRDIMGSSVAIL